MIYKESGAKFLITDRISSNYSNGIEIVSSRKLYLDSEGLNTKIEEVLFECKVESNQVAELLFTSGTTGMPKGVMLSYKAIYNILNNTIDGIGVDEKDILLLPLPLNHSFALRVLRAVLYKGATVILQNGFTFAKEVENNIRLFGCNSMACVPASYEVMKTQMQDKFSIVLGNLKYIEFGAGSLSISQRREIVNLLPKVDIYNTWGSSETGGAIFCNVSEVCQDEELCGTLGKVIPGKIQICIQDMDGNVISSNKDNPGRMVIKGDMLMSGYWNDDKLTKETLQNGWIKTSDLAYIRNGYIFMLGRVDDIINVGGEKVSPVEVENIAGQYDSIVECACIATKDPKGVLGQVPVLFIVCKGFFSEDDFSKYLASKMERYKLPQRIIKVATLPRNRMKKVDRKELKNLLENKIEISLMNPVVESILSRRSVRKFTEKSIDRAILNMIIKCGYYAPSSRNMQTWRFTVLDKKKDIEILKEKTRIAAHNKEVYFYGWENPQAIIIVSNDARNNCGCQDSSCAAENMMLAARSLGIGSVWLNSLMTLRDESPVNMVLDKLGIPKNHIVWACIALGYPVMDGHFLQRKDSVVQYVSLDDIDDRTEI